MRKRRCRLRYDGALAERRATPLMNQRSCHTEMAIREPSSDAESSAKAMDDPDAAAANALHEAPPHCSDIPTVV